MRDVNKEITLSAGLSKREWILPGVGIDEPEQRRLKTLGAADIPMFESEPLTLLEHAGLLLRTCFVRCASPPSIAACPKLDPGNPSAPLCGGGNYPFCRRILLAIDDAYVPPMAVRGARMSHVFRTNASYPLGALLVFRQRRDDYCNQSATRDDT